jgi:anti-sigma factor RsiW
MTPESLGHPGDLLSAHLDDELAPDVAAEVEAHVDSCAACRAELAELGGARDALRASPRVPAPPGFTRDLVRTRQRAARRGVGLMLVAASVAVIAGLVLAPAHPDTSDRPSLGLQSAARFEADLSNGPTTTSGVSTLRAQEPASPPASTPEAAPTDEDGGQSLADRVGDAVGALLDAIGG